MFDIKKIPFSRYGSFLTISPLSNQEGEKTIYVRSVRGGDMGTEHGKIFKISLINGRKKDLAFDVEMKETELKLKAANGEVSFCIEEKGILRAFGEGVGLRLIMDATSYDNAIPYGEGRYRIICSRLDLKFILTTVEGVLRVNAPWEVDRSKYIIVDFLPKNNTGKFHGVLEEFITACTQREYVPSYQLVLQRVQTEYRDWKNKILKVPPELDRGRELASYITWSCVVPAEGILSRKAMYMSKNWMTNIWSWDHCFNALALIRNNPDLAWEQLMVFFDLQDISGVLPDFINDKFAYYCFTKPPIHGWTLNYMLAENPDYFTEERLIEVYQPLKKWTKYWFRYTDHYGEELPAYHHGNDAGWDNSTIFELGAPLQSPDLLSFLILQMKTLSRIAVSLGREREGAYWEEKANTSLTKLIKYFWNGKRFIPRKHGYQAKDFSGDSLIMLIPIVLGGLLPDEIKNKLIAALKEEGRFLTDYGLSTESISSKFYCEDGYWRGPIWAPVMLLIIDGLERAGERNFAVDLAERFCRMANENGMSENFNALSGKGLRDPAFTWTSSVFLVLANKYFNSKGNPERRDSNNE